MTTVTRPETSELAVENPIVCGYCRDKACVSHTTAEVAAYIGVDVQTVRKMIRQKRIPSYRPTPGTYRVRTCWAHEAVRRLAS